MISYWFNDKMQRVRLIEELMKVLGEYMHAHKYTMKENEPGLV